MTSSTLTLMLAAAALCLPVVLVLVAYDARWIVLSLRAGQWPPWGTYVRLFAALCCHGGAAVLVAYGSVWPAAKLTFWLHMTLDPGLTFYALGLYELVGRLKKRQAVASAALRSDVTIAGQTSRGV